MAKQHNLDINTQEIIHIPPHNDSGTKHPYNPHYMFNCASSFESLALHLTEIMWIQPPNLEMAIWWINRCIMSRQNVIIDRQNKGEDVDEGHIKVVKMLENLKTYIEYNIQVNEPAFFLFLNNQQRFLVQGYSGKKATIVWNGAYFNELLYTWPPKKRNGGRKSTRKNRKTNRKTYRILPKVEGS